MTPHVHPDRAVCLRYLAAVLAGLIVAGHAGLAPAQPVPPNPATRPATTSPSTRPTINMAGMSPIELARASLAAYDEQRYEDASAMCQRALELRPDEPDALLCYSLLLILQQRHAEAIDPLKTYLEKSEGKTSHRGFEALGDIYLKSFMFRQAHDCFERALQQAPKELRGEPIKALIQVKDAACLRGMNQIKPALALLNDAVNTWPNSPKFRWELARLLVVAGKHDEAQLSMETAVQLLLKLLNTQYEHLAVDPNAPSTQGNLELLRDMQKTEYTNVMALLNTTKEPKQASPLLVKLSRSIAAQAESNRLIELHRACNLAKDAVKVDADNLEAQVELARCQKSTRMLAAARQTLKKILEKRPDHRVAADMLSELAPAGRPGPSTRPAAAAVMP